MAQQQPGDMPYSSQFLRKLELYIGDLISHQSGDIGYASIFVLLVQHPEINTHSKHPFLLWTKRIGAP